MVLADGLRASMCNDCQVDVATGIERQCRKRAQFAASKRLIALGPKLCLDSPIFAASIASDQVDAFVEIRKVHYLANVGRHIAQQPDILERRAIFGLALKVELNKPLECAPLLAIRNLSHPLAKFVPR